jgi:hypothetical protein
MWRFLTTVLLRTVDFVAADASVSLELLFVTVVVAVVEEFICANDGAVVTRSAIAVAIDSSFGALSIFPPISRP